MFRTSDTRGVTVYSELVLPYQEGGARNGKGLFVEIGAAEEQQDVSGVLRLVELQQLGQFSQLVQV